MLKAQTVGDQQLGFEQVFGICRFRLKHVCVFIGANQRRDLDTVPANGLDQIAEDAEAGHHREFVGSVADSSNRQQRHGEKRSE